MELQRLAFDAPLAQYQQQADWLIAHAREAEAVELFQHHHPRFLRSDVPWLPKDLSEAEVRGAALDVEDARLALARWYDFRDWPALRAYAEAVGDPRSPVWRFESAVEAVIAGQAGALQALLRADPELPRARSTRITHFDPPVHRATLLHYIAANGVEGYRQKTPANAVEILRMLLAAGAEPDALADLYGGHYTTMSMLVSSCHPAQAGLQVALLETLLNFGAALDARGSEQWGSPLMTALVFGYQDAAAALVRRGARVDRLDLAAGLGRVAQSGELLASASAEERHRALALAAMHGHAEIVRLLLDAGEDPDRFNPAGLHAHGTPLHHAALGGHEEVVRLLVERGARLDLEDKIYRATPLGWAQHAGRSETAEYLRQAAHQQIS